MIWDKNHIFSNFLPLLSIRVKTPLDGDAVGKTAYLNIYSYWHVPCVSLGPETLVAELRCGIKLEHFWEMLLWLFPPLAQQGNYG